MGMQWSLVSESVDDPHLIEGWLKKGFEPFHITDGGTMWLKVQVWVEDDPKASEYEGQPSEEVDDAGSGGPGRVGQDDASQEDQ